MHCFGEATPRHGELDGRAVPGPGGVARQWLVEVSQMLGVVKQCRFGEVESTGPRRDRRQERCRRHGAGRIVPRLGGGQRSFERRGLAREEPDEALRVQLPELGICVGRVDRRLEARQHR
jgi:hypothetical protein